MISGPIRIRVRGTHAVYVGVDRSFCGHENFSERKRIDGLSIIEIFDKELATISANISRD
jgi:hypothetical protein